MGVQELLFAEAAIEPILIAKNSETHNPKLGSCNKEKLHK